MSHKRPTPDQDAEWIERCRLSLDQFFSPSEAELADSLFADTGDAGQGTIPTLVPFE